MNTPLTTTLPIHNKHKQAGQTFPMTLAALIMIAGIIMISFNLGRLLLKKQRLEHKADVIAFSAGVDYARTLNLANAANKSFMFATIGSVLSFNPLFVYKVAKKGQQVLDYTFGTAKRGRVRLNGQQVSVAFFPALNFISGYGMMASNHTQGILLWNQKKFSDFTPLPDLNLEPKPFREALNDLRRVCGETFASAICNSIFKDSEETQICERTPLLCQQSDSDQETEVYSFRDNATGEINYVDSSRVRTVPRSNGGVSYLYTNPNDSRRSSSFVSRRKIKMSVLDFGLKERSRHHSVTVILSEGNLLETLQAQWSRFPQLSAFISKITERVQPSQNRASNFLIRKLPAMSSVAKVEVGGGHLRLSDDETGANFGVYFVPVRASNETQSSRNSFRGLFSMVRKFAQMEILR